MANKAALLSCFCGLTFGALWRPFLRSSRYHSPFQTMRAPLMLQEAGDPPGSALVILHSVLEAAVSLALLAANLSTLDRRFILHLHYPLSSSLMDTSTLVRSCPLKCSNSATVSLHVGENCVPVSCVAWVSPMGRFAPRLRWLGTKASVFVLFLGCLPFLVPCVLCSCHIEYSRFQS